ncbi:MAG: elongation factor P [Planctomycetaceae bacterium]|nr:elongation factor P [Planctomycetaceae bacterium]
MATISTSDFRKGTKVVVEGDPFEMIMVEFVKPGKGQALYKCKLRNLLKGSLLDRTYKSGDGLEGADVRRNDGQYLYKDNDSYVFMDQQSFEQFHIQAVTVGEQARFLQDGMVCELLYWNDQPIGVTLPGSVVMKVNYTEPAVRGNTSSNITKAAKVDNNIEIQVPAFVDTGDLVKINTQTGEYIERVRE